VSAAPWILVVTVAALVGSWLAAALARRRRPQPGRARVTFEYSSTLRLILFATMALLPLGSALDWELRGLSAVFTVTVPVGMAIAAAASFIDVSSSWIGVDDKGIDRWTPWGGYARIPWSQVVDVRRAWYLMTTEIVSRTGTIVRLSDLQQGRGWVAVALVTKLGRAGVITPPAMIFLEQTVKALEAEAGGPARWPSGT
jgi:hypothetical protein